MNIALFTYSFPHKRTQDFLFRLNLSGLRPEIVIASPSFEINLPKTIIKDKYAHIDLLLPKQICNSLAINYIEMSHKDKDLLRVIKESKIELGVIAGARILSKGVINIVERGIINFHPGLIPENRGLNAAKWAVCLDIPQGLTAHFIDEKIDWGRIINRYIIPVYSSDSLKDINLRIDELQVALLINTLKLIALPGFKSRKIKRDISHHPPADKRIDRQVLLKFKDYIKKWAYDKNGWVCKCGIPLPRKENINLSCRQCSAEYKRLKESNCEFLEIIQE